MLPQDKQVLEFIRDASDGSVSRERLLKAFKRSGATIGKFEGSPTIFFGTDFMAVGRGEIEMSTPHQNYRNRLSTLAANVLKYNELQADRGFSHHKKIKRAAKPVVFPFDVSRVSP